MVAAPLEETPQLLLLPTPHSLARQVLAPALVALQGLMVPLMAHVTRLERLELRALE